MTLVNRPRAMIFASQDIKAFQEITIDYKVRLFQDAYADRRTHSFESIDGSSSRCWYKSVSMSLWSTDVPRLVCQASAPTGSPNSNQWALSATQSQLAGDDAQVQAPENAFFPAACCVNMPEWTRHLGQLGEASKPGAQLDRCPGPQQAQCKVLHKLLI